MVALASALGDVSGARADSRGVCVETSATSAPTRAPLALDAERAAWVVGLRANGRDVALGERWPGPSRAPVWCDAGDGPQCEQGNQAPAQQDLASASDAGSALAAGGERAAPGYVVRSGHPPIHVGQGAAGTRSELERPPRPR
jgi:hypothetical protein